ncbi:MAG: SDR family oxidoreductase [Gemmatimonadales bacterium]
MLVAGASGLLGGRVCLRLLDLKVPVRALTRTPPRLKELAHRGAEVVKGDLLDPGSLARACQGVAQLFSTANSFMGRGPTSPNRVDVAGYRHLAEAARAAGVVRWIHTSAYGIGPESPVDYFRVKAAVDEVVKGSGLGWVLLRPSAFLDVWVGMALEQLGKGAALVFGSGRTRANYIAVDDVVRFAVEILRRPDIVNETIDLGGPSTLTQPELLSLIERQQGRPLRRRKVPRVMLRAASVVVRPFNELAARFSAMGAWVAAMDRALPHWELAARRFGIEPMTAEAFLAGHPLAAA